MNEFDHERVKSVFERRSMYDAVVEYDYMHHAELTMALGAWATAFGRPLRVVDLGCGDAGLATSGFRRATVERYVGVDLAESSIEQARRNAAIWAERAEFVCGNFYETLQRLPNGSANAVLASYSLHHFSTADKRRLLDDVRRLLEPGGAFLWIDAVHRNGESREAYIDRLTSAISRDWIGLTVEERQHGVEHVRTSDYPETESWMLDSAQAAGFTLDAVLLEAEFFQGWAFSKP